MERITETEIILNWAEMKLLFSLFLQHAGYLQEHETVLDFTFSKKGFTFKIGAEK